MKRTTMPLVNIKITKEGATAKQKKQLIEGSTKLLQDVLGKKGVKQPELGGIDLCKNCD